MWTVITADVVVGSDMRKVVIEEGEATALSEMVFNLCDAYLSQKSKDGRTELKDVFICLSALDNAKEAFLLGLKDQGIEVQGREYE